MKLKNESSERLLGLHDVLEVLQQVYVQLLLVQRAEVRQLLNELRVDASFIEHVHQVIVEALWNRIRQVSRSKANFKSIAKWKTYAVHNFSRHHVHAVLHGIAFVNGKLLDVEHVFCKIHKKYLSELRNTMNSYNMDRQAYDIALLPVFASFPPPYRRLAQWRS